MNSLKVQWDSRWWRCQGEAISIGQVLDFDEQQPRFFGVEPASSEALQAGDFVGDTERGGSCNVRRISLVPHCNGTHTESAAHIDSARPEVLACAPQQPLVAALASVKPRPVSECRDPLPDCSASGDEVIDLDGLGALLGRFDPLPPALILRSQAGGGAGQDWDARGFAYFTAKAGAALREHGVRHLLLDTPSLDRGDDPDLSAHHAFFGSADEALPMTITEMCVIPTAIQDGHYLLNLQIAPFAGDASPSRPLITPLEPVTMSDITHD